MLPVYEVIKQNHSTATTLTNANIFVGNSLNVATIVPVSGEATLANTGAITLSNAAVIAKVLTGFVSGAGTITATDSILSAIEKLDGNIAVISPLTTKGDLYTYDTAPARLAVGSDAQILMADAAATTGNKWVSWSGDVVIGLTGATTIGANAVTYAKMQQASATTLLGNPTGALANISEITLGAGLSFAGTTLVGTGGTVTSVSVVTNQGVSGSVATATTTPAITISLGDLTGVTSFNGLVVTANTGAITTGSWAATVIPLAFGGTAANLTASNGGIFYSTATEGAILAGTATAGLALVSGASTTPSWFTPTAGSIIFAGVGGILEQDNSNLFFDNTTNRLGIGTNSPSEFIHVLNSGGNAAIRLQSQSAKYAGFQMYDSNANNSWAIGHEFNAPSNAKLVFSYGTIANENVVAYVLHGGGATFNENGNDSDFRVESDTKTHMIFVDASVNAVGINNSSPSAYLHLGAGTNVINTAPLKFTSGTSLTSPVAGAIEFTTDDLFFTITTGAARKAFVLDDGTRLTSGLIPVATTNGRLINGPTPAADGTYANPTSITISKGLITAIL